MITISIIIAVLTMLPWLMFVNVFCAVLDYRPQKLEKGGKTAIGITPYDSTGLSHLATFGACFALVTVGGQIWEKPPTLNLGYLFIVCYVVIMPTFEILTRTAARWKEPDIQFSKFLWMKR
jgi:4-hydroxybenzoate polyprenyltransferase